MPISAEQWRVSIGRCYTNIPVVSRNVVRCSPWSILLDLLLSPLMVIIQWWSGESTPPYAKDGDVSCFSMMGGVHKKTNDSGHSLLAVFLLIIVSCLLLRSGNVERNPGPVDQLTIKDLVRVRDELFEACTSWEDIGLGLYLDPTALEIISVQNSDVKSRFREMLKVWLKQTSPHPTWSALVVALNKPAVGFSQLAEQIRKKYIDPPPGGESTCASNHPDQQSSEMNASSIVDAVKFGTDNENETLEQLTLAEHVPPPPPGSSSEGESMRGLMDPDQQSITGSSEASASNNDAVKSGTDNQNEHSSDEEDQSISARVKRLQDTFYKLVECAEKDLEASKVDVDQFATRMTVVHYEIRQQHKEFFEKHFVKLEKGTTINDLLRQLHFYWDFLNYSLLQEIVDKFGNEELKKDMSTYVTRLQQFRKTTRVCEFVEYMPKMGAKPPCTELQEFVVKNKRVWKECTLEDLEQLKVMITHRFLLPEFTLILKDITEGCVSITWVIPTPIAAALREDIENMGDREFFKKHQIDLITINGQECYYSPVKKYAAYLKGIYSSKEGKNLAPFKLARINKIQVNRQTMDSFTRLSIRGDMDDVVYYKSSLTESEIGLMGYYDFDKREQIQCKPKLVVIEGAPGVGKTTFSSQFCYKWSQGQVLQEYSLLVLLPLRDNRVKSAKTIADLFHHSEQTVVQEIEKSQGEGIILWLEGFDELDKDLRTKSSVFFDLIHGKILPKATIFVTSRPWASQDIVKKLSKETDQHIELLTTPKIQLDRVLRGTTLTTSLAKLFIEYTSSNAAILAAMHTPITADIAAEVFKWSQETDSSPPTTMTQLYTTFTLKLLTQHLTNKEGWKKLDGFDDLPDDVYKQFLSLCELAYNGLLKQQLVFSDLPSEFKSLGLMKTVEQLYGDDDHTHQSYNFIHLTLQEYLAAFYISRLPSQEQTTLIHQHHKSSHFKITLRFLAGITHLAHLTPVLTQQLLDSDKLTLFHWLFEASDVSIVTTILGEDEVYVESSYSWTPLDFYVTGYCLSLSNCGWHLVFYGFLDDDGLKMFSRGVLLNSEAKCRGYISQASFGSIISQNTLTVEGMRWFVQLPQRVFRGLRSLNLSYKKLNKETLTVLAEAIPVMTSLEELNISFNPVGHGGAVDLFKSLCTNNTTLRVLDLTSTGIGEDDSIVLVELLSCCNLTTLRINKMSSDSVSSIMTGLNKNNSLEDLNMSNSQLTLESIALLSSALQQPQCQLEALDIPECTMTSEVAVQLATGLTNNQSLKSLNLSRTSIGDDGAVALADMLSVNKHMEELHVSRCNITSQGAVQLATGLTNNLSLKALYLSDTSIGDDGAVALADMLSVNKHMEELHVSRCNITSQGAVQLATGLTNNHSLKTLYLSYTSIGDDGAVALADMLSVNKHMEKLHVSHCNITSQGAVQLATVLSNKNSTLKILNISWNTIGPSGVAAFAKMIQENKSLEELVLHRDDSLGKEGVHQLISAMKNNTTLKQLWLPLRYKTQVDDVRIRWL